METGGTQRQHLERSAAKGNARSAALLAAHPLPHVFRDLWEAFRTLDPWRGAGGFGAAPLTLADIREYEARYGVRFLPGELDVLKHLDLIVLTAQAA